MKKFLLIITIALAIVPLAASAHVFLTDGGITVLMHVNPNDDPVAGQPATLLFGITDISNKFNAANCDCQVTVKDSSGKQLLSVALPNISTQIDASLYEFSEPFTFPDKDVYSIEVTGKPKTANTFQTFDVNYSLRVDQAITTSTPTKSSNQWWYYAGGAIVFIAAIIFIIKKR